jgi:hypothetical protein
MQLELQKIRIIEEKRKEKEIEKQKEAGKIKFFS